MVYKVDRLTVWHLANDADCAGPDSPDSPGAQFLEQVQDAVVELTEHKPDTEPDDMDYDGAVHELADSAVPVYTHEFWQTFVDLAAYAEDTSDYGPLEDVEQTCKVGVYMIAERLAHALLAEWWTDDDD